MIAGFGNLSGEMDTDALTQVVHSLIDVELDLPLYDVQQEDDDYYNIIKTLEYD